MLVEQNAQLKDRSALDPVGVYPEGVTVFARMISRWMDGNAWSHPTMANLATACMDGTGWLHTSSIAGLRRGETKNPGPRSFVAIERLNYYLWRYTQTKQLIPNTKSSNLYAEATPITENGEPPTLGWFVEVFCGYRIPQDFDCGGIYFTERRAELISKAYGRLIRRLAYERALDPVDDMQHILSNYPISDPRRVRRMRELIAGTATLSSEDLQMELPSMTALSEGLCGPSTEDDLLAALS